jgi:hypothetical protein
MRGIDDRMQERQDRINGRGQDRTGLMGGDRKRQERTGLMGEDRERTGKDRINGRQQGKDRKGQD